MEMRPEVVTKAPLQQAPTQVSHQGYVKKCQLEKEAKQNHEQDLRGSGLINELLVAPKDMLLSRGG